MFTAAYVDRAKEMKRKNNCIRVNGYLFDHRVTTPNRV